MYLSTILNYIKVETVKKFLETAT